MSRPLVHDNWAQNRARTSACDFCNTKNIPLQKCQTCTINICKPCLSTGSLESDPRHMLARDSADNFVWHQSRKDRGGARPAAVRRHQPESRAQPGTVAPAHQASAPQQPAAPPTLADDNRPTTLGGRGDYPQHGLQMQPMYRQPYRNLTPYHQGLAQQPSFLPHHALHPDNMYMHPRSLDQNLTYGRGDGNGAWDGVSGHNNQRPEQQIWDSPYAPSTWYPPPNHHGPRNNHVPTPHEETPHHQPRDAWFPYPWPGPQRTREQAPPSSPLSAEAPQTHHNPAVLSSEASESRTVLPSRNNPDARGTKRPRTAAPESSGEDSGGDTDELSHYIQASLGQSSSRAVPGAVYAAAEPAAKRPRYDGLPEMPPLDETVFQPKKDTVVKVKLRVTSEADQENPRNTFKPSRPEGQPQPAQPAAADPREVEDPEA